MSTPDDDFLLAAVNARLTAVAEASQTPPAWYDDWMRFGPESPAEQRLAVYQAIRDSGCLPDEAGFCLVSWCAEGMADREAETSLRNLVDRMEALEKAYESEKGEPWPDDQVPEEYEELWRRQQAAWDEIFVRTLEAAGEQEMAEFYSAAPERYERCYKIGLYFLKPVQTRTMGDMLAAVIEIGLQRLLGPIKTGKAISADELVRLTSCLDVPRADLARLALAKEGIPAALGNATFLSWHWHYSNAVGGVTIHVRNRDAQQARKALIAARAKPSASLPPWICSSCGQRIAGQWNACWQCGRSTDGAPASPHAEVSAAQPQDDAGAVIWLNVPRLFTAVAILLLVVLLNFRCMSPLVLAPFVVILIFLLWQFEPSSSGESQPQGSAGPPDQSSHSQSSTRSEVSKAIVRRAWQAAVIAALSFPPLGFYSMRLLWKLGRRDTPLGLADKWRCGTAFFLNIATILSCLAIAGVVVLAVAHIMAVR
jgi:hypothetical protein